MARLASAISLASSKSACALSGPVRAPFKNRSQARVDGALGIGETWNGGDGGKGCQRLGLASGKKQIEHKLTKRTQGI